ncbi:hypothetical protein OWV82_019084, partial [Melia azedarach]
HIFFEVFLIELLKFNHPFKFKDQDERINSPDRELGAPLMRRGVKLRTKGSDGVGGSHVVEAQRLVQRINFAGSHVATAGDHIGVASFDFRREIQKQSHRIPHLRQERRGNIVVHDPETSPFFTCFSQLRVLCRKILKIYRRDSRFRPCHFHLISSFSSSSSFQYFSINLFSLFMYFIYLLARDYDIKETCYIRTRLSRQGCVILSEF